MKFEEIIEQVESRADFALYGQRFSLIAGNKCRIYRFEKKLGVHLTMYCDHQDPSLSDYATTSQENQDFSSVKGEGPFMIVKVEALNVETNEFEQIELRGGNAFPFQHKKSSHIEMILDPAHINDDSKFTIRVHFRFLLINEIRKGFLQKRVTKEGHITPTNQAELTCTLLDEFGPKPQVSTYDANAEFENSTSEEGWGDW